MRIAQVAPLYESVPPRLYGGTERVVSYLTEELVAMGHDVTLFASGDSDTEARLVAGSKRSLRLDGSCIDTLAHHYVLLDMVAEQAEDFDIIHFHTDYLHLPMAKLLSLPHVTTLHGRLDCEDLVPLYRRYRDTPLVSISRHQRKPLCWANWVATVYHGLPADLLSEGNGRGKYLAFVGRISREKRVDRAIEIALRVGMPLKIAAKVDRGDREYYETEIKPLLSQPNIEYVGEITESQKADFFGNAYAYLFPIDWPEPFGLTMIESMACGTPTIAYNCGSVPEVLTPGVSGTIVKSIDEAVLAVEDVSGMDRGACRLEFEKRFTASTMAQNYIAVYEAIVGTPALSAEASESDSLLTL
jgi:glycosyltransferase involved in cell wall biosynthesis